MLFGLASQGDIVPRGQCHVVTLHLAADDVQVTGGGDDADVALAADGAAHRRLVVAGLAGTGAGGADADRTD